MTEQWRWLTEQETLERIVDLVAHQVLFRHLREEVVSGTLERLTVMRPYLDRKPPVGKWVPEHMLIEHVTEEAWKVRDEAKKYGQRHVYLGSAQGDLSTVRDSRVAPDVHVAQRLILEGAYSHMNVRVTLRDAKRAQERLEEGRSTPEQVEKDQEALASAERLVENYPDYLALRHDWEGGEFVKRQPHDGRRHGPRSKNPMRRTYRSHSSKGSAVVNKKPLRPVGMEEYLKIQEAISQRHGKVVRQS